MKIKKYIRRLLAYPLQYFKKWDTLLKKNGNDRFLILMYHRIINKGESETFLQDGMYVEPNTFRRHIIYLKNNFNLMSLEHFFCDISTKYIPINNKPFCILTFDDGWKDFYENVYPILKSFNVCATVFLTTDYIDTNKIFWSEKIATMLYKIEKDGKNITKFGTQYNPIIDKIENLKDPIEIKIEKAIEILKTLNNDDIEIIIEKMAKKWGVEINLKRKSFLSWDEVREMHQTGIISFGSHTRSHKILTEIPEKEVREELIHSREKLIEEKIVSRSFIPFAYPNGNYTDKIAEMVKETGYSLALTTKKGWNCPTADNRTLYHLKRVGIHQDMSSTNAMFACRIHGIY